MQEQEISIFETTQVVYAGFWQRFAAALIDGLIILVPTFIIKQITGEDNILTELIHHKPITAGVCMYEITLLIMGWLYFALMESGKQQATVGKMALGLKVTDMEGQRISFGKATGRHFGKLVSEIILFFGYFMMLWDEKNQTLHDKMAGTLVVKNNPII